MLIKCDSEHVEQFSNSLHFCIAGGFKEDCVGILSLRFFGRKNVMWLVEDEKVLTIYFSRFHTTPACFRQTVWYAVRKSRDCTHQFHSACRYNVASRCTCNLDSENLHCTFLRFCSSYCCSTCIL